LLLPKSPFEPRVVAGGGSRLSKAREWHGGKKNNGRWEVVELRVLTKQPLKVRFNGGRGTGSRENGGVKKTRGREDATNGGEIVRFTLKDENQRAPHHENWTDANAKIKNVKKSQGKPKLPRGEHGDTAKTVFRSGDSGKKTDRT